MFSLKKLASNASLKKRRFAMGKKVFLISLWTVLVLLTAGPAFAETDLPGELKNAISPYPGAKVIQTVSMENSTMTTFEVSDKPEAVLDFYKKELKDHGWDINIEMGQDNPLSLFARKGSTALVMDTIADKTGKTLVNFTLTGK
jgi:hypothetical protein